MFKTVGPLPKQVYWRRRALLAAGAVLVVVTALVVYLGTRGSGSGSNGAAAPAVSASDGTADGEGASSADPSASGTASGNASPAGSGSPTGAPPSGAASSTPAASTPAPSSTPASTTSATGADATPAACTSADLKVTASTSLPSYPVGASPGLNMIVTNVGSQPCIADLSDSNIVLLVYFGDARIWGSHDCNIEPGSSPQTLPMNEPVTRQIVWTGLSSNEGCTATRQRVGPGTYTLQPVFAGQNGAPVTFTIA